MADTWEARQGARFRELIAEIDGCASLAELAEAFSAATGKSFAQAAESCVAE